MSVAVPTLPQTAPTPYSGAVSQCRANVQVDNRLTVPGWINTLDDYRRWAESDEYPKRGWVSYLNGTIVVDLSMEEFLTHNRVKCAFNNMFAILLQHEPPGYFTPDRMLLVNAAANLSTEPDGLFYLWTTMKSGRLRLVPGTQSGYMELDGTPDVVLEIVSDGSVTKDLVTLRELYWKAQIPEYWLVDARKDAIRFDILRRGDAGYAETPPGDGWQRSEILKQSFRIERSTDPLGLPQFLVQTKA